MKRRFSVLGLWLAAVISASTISACGGSSPAGTITVTLTPANSASVDQGQSMVIQATVSGDVKNAGVTWSLSTSVSGTNCQSSSAPCGTLNSSAFAVTYTAPTGLTSASSFTLTAASLSNNKATAAATISVVLAPTFTTTSPLLAGENGVPYSQTVSVTSGLPPFSYSIAAGALPPGLHLNVTGVINGTPTCPVPSTPCAPGSAPYNFTVQAADSGNPPQTVSQSFTITVTHAAPPVIGTASLPGGTVGTPYTAPLSVTGGQSPFTFSVSGSLPPGLTLNSTTGQISGIPTMAGPFPSFTVQARDSSIPVQTSAGQVLSIAVAPPAPLNIPTASPLPPPAAGVPYNTTIQAVGGVQPYTLSVTSGQLPAGLSLDPNSGLIFGTPAISGTSTFTIQVADSETVPLTFSKAFSMQVTAKPFGGRGIFQLAVSQNGTGAYTNVGPTEDEYSASAAYPPFDFGKFTFPSGGTWVFRFTVTGKNPASSGYTMSFNYISLTPTTTSTATLYAATSLTVAGSSGQAVSTIRDPNCDGGSCLLYGSTATGNFLSLDVNIPAAGTYDIAADAGSNNFNLLNGSYAFVFRGFNTSGPEYIGGILNANGTGTVDGVADINSGAVLALNQTFTGTYTIGSDGRGTIAFTLPSTAPPPFPSVTFHYLIALDGNGNARFIESEPAGSTGAGNTGSGILRKQISTAYSNGSLIGNYAFGLSGLDSASKEFATAGQFHADGSGNIPIGVLDENDAGTVTSNVVILSGSYTIGTNGRGLLSLTIPPASSSSTTNITLTYEAYLVSQSDVLLMSADAFNSSAKNPRANGEALLQGATFFGANSLSGPGSATCVLAGTGLNSSGNSDVLAGIFTADSSGNITQFISDENNAGAVTSTSGSPQTGTYAVSLNGRVTFTSTGNKLAVAYLASPASSSPVSLAKGFVLGTDSSATLSFFQAQPAALAGSFTLASFQDGYALGTDGPPESRVSNVIGELAADGGGNLTGTVDSLVPPSTTNAGQSLVSTYSPSANGRGTITLTSPTAGIPTTLAFYILSPGQVRLVSATSGDAHPQVFFLDH